MKFDITYMKTKYYVAYAIAIYKLHYLGMN